MATTEVWDNDDGLVIKFGRERSASARAGEVRTAGPLHILTMDFDFADVERALGAGFDVDSDAGGDFDSFSGMQTFIPANSLVTRATLFALTDWADSAGTMNIDIGTYQKDGTGINTTGIDAAIVEAALDAGDLVECNGAVVGTFVGANDAYIGVIESNSATLSAGTARLVIEYMPPLV